MRTPSGGPYRSGSRRSFVGRRGDESMLVICRSQLSIWSFCIGGLGALMHATTQTGTRTSGERAPVGTPMARGSLLATLTALILLSQGCGAVILSSSWGVRPEMLSVASDREKVEAKLGRPIDSRPTSDGGRVDTYDYRVYKASDRPLLSKEEVRDFLRARELGAVMLMAYLTVDTLFITPYAAYKWKTHPRSQVKIAFGPDGRLAWIGSPPPYGPPDGAVEPPSIGAIRTRCRSQDEHEPSSRQVGGDENLRPSEDLYVRCVVRGFAIWGIE